MAIRRIEMRCFVLVMLLSILIVGCGASPASSRDISEVIVREPPDDWERDASPLQPWLDEEPEQSDLPIVRLAPEWTDEDSQLNLPSAEGSLPIATENPY
jgi:hypothetical protein